MRIRRFRRFRTHDEQRVVDDGVPADCILDESDDPLRDEDGDFILE